MAALSLTRASDSVSSLFRPLLREMRDFLADAPILHQHAPALRRTLVENRQARHAIDAKVPEPHAQLAPGDEHARLLEKGERHRPDDARRLFPRAVRVVDAHFAFDLQRRADGVDIVVVDSVAALVPRAEIEGEMGDAHMGLQARLMSQALRKLTAAISKSQTTLIFINQIRMKIGVMFGSPETTTGGNALKFYASVRIDIRRTGTIKKGEEAIGNETKVKVVKNKVAPPFKTAEFDILFGEGISREGEIIDMGVNARIIEKSGAWYAYNGEKIGQGRDNAREFLRENLDLAHEIENKVRESLGIPLLATSVQADEA